MHSKGVQSAFIITLITMIASTGAKPVSHMEIPKSDTQAGTEKELESMETTRPIIEPIRYHFITEHRPTSLGQNYYLKPGQVVGTFTLDTPPLQVRHEENDDRTLGSKHNILFVAYAKDMVMRK
ncbi:hypothetical protein KR009_005540 [Drosophila setifemur]|nr:hypothetical protein KR009_005540 [Drosophila setifemur]